MGLLDGKVALVTGGSRGIGKAIALKFASEGADVVFTYLSNKAAAEQTEQELGQFGHRVKAYASDASSFESAHELVKQVIEDFSRIDILVNNAGMTRDTLLMRMTEQQWDEVLNGNLKSAFNFTHAVVPLMARQLAGNIISLSSVVGIAGNAGQANYAASKAGIIALSTSVAKEMGSRNVRCNCIAPGFIETDMTSSLPEELRKEWAKTIPLRRCGTPEEVANVALFLASDLSSYVTGQVIHCCGGMSY